MLSRKFGWLRTGIFSLFAQTSIVIPCEGAYAQELGDVFVGVIQMAIVQRLVE